MEFKFLIFCVFWFAFVFKNGVNSEVNKLIDFTCTADEDCGRLLTDKNSECIDEHCVCKKKNVVVECRMRNSKTSNFIGGACPCLLKNSVCNPSLDQCVCQENFIPSLDKRRCLRRMMELDKVCEYDEQCMRVDHLSICDKDTKVCVCGHNTTNVHSVCRTIVGKINKRTMMKNVLEIHKINTSFICMINRK